MKITQIIFLGVAVAAGAAAFMMTNRTKPTLAPVAASRVAPAEATGSVLVASHDIQMGAVLSASDLLWQAWPRAAISSGMITQAADPKAFTQLQGSIARSAFLKGEPIQQAKLVNGPKSGFMAAILPEGERAVSINIDAQGSNTAGGFILPNDRVDVLRTEHVESTGRAANPNDYKTRIILSNIRVLAIGQNIEEKNNKRVVVGSNATLEVTPEQAQILVEAQRVGTLSLALRSMLDSNGPTKIDDPNKDAVTVVRYGVAASSGQD